MIGKNRSWLQLMTFYILMFMSVRSWKKILFLPENI